MKKFVSENSDNINSFYSWDKKKTKATLGCGAGPDIEETVSGTTELGTIQGRNDL